MRTYGSSGEEAMKTYLPPNSETAGARRFTGYGTTLKFAGGGMGGPLGPRPRPSRT